MPREQFMIGELLHIGVGYPTNKILARNSLYQITQGEGTVVPASGGANYAVGCKYRLVDAANGQCPEWINIGSVTSCLFVPVGPVTGYGVVTGGHGPVSIGGDATEILYDNNISAGDIAFVEHGVCDDADQICAALPADGKITITATADPTAGAKQYNYVVLRDKIFPEWDIFAAGSRTAIASDTTAVPISVPGVIPGDVAMATYNTTNDNDLISQVVCTANTVTITVNNDPVTDHAWDYVVFRKRGSFKPSHYIVAAGVHTTVGGDDTETITVSGILTTDKLICKYHTTDDTDAFEYAKITAADTITVVLDNDPGKTHKLSYMVLRAYA